MSEETKVIFVKIEGNMEKGVAKLKTKGQSE